MPKEVHINEESHEFKKLMLSEKCHYDEKTPYL